MVNCKHTNKINNENVIKKSEKRIYHKYAVCVRLCEGNTNKKRQTVNSVISSKANETKRDRGEESENDSASDTNNDR